MDFENIEYYTLNVSVYLKEKINDFGVLKQYENKKLTREEADKIVSDSITKHLFMKGKMIVDLSIWYTKNDGTEGIYLSVSIKNFNYDEQKEINGNKLEFEII